MNNIYAHEVALGTYLYNQLSKIESLTLYGPSPGEKDISYAKRTGRNDTFHDRYYIPRNRLPPFLIGISSYMNSISFTNRAVVSSGLVAFNCKTVHATDLSFFLDQEGVAVRTGHHCTQPLHAALGAAGSVRASLYFYNNQEDIDTFIVKLKDTIAMFETMG